MIDIDIDVDFFVEDKDRIWFINTESDGLFFVDLFDLKIHFVRALPDSPKFRLYTAGIKCGEKLFFFPFNAEKILVYDIKKEIFEEIKSGDLKSGSAQYTICFQYKQLIIAVSTYGENSIIIYDLKCNHLKKMEMTALNAGNLSRDYVIRDDRLFLAFIDRPIILEINLNNNECIMHEMAEVERGFGTICKINDLLILSGVNGIYTWNCFSEEFHLVSKYPPQLGVQDKNGNLSAGFSDDEVPYKQPFWKSCKFGQEIYFVASIVNMSLAYDYYENRIREINLNDNEDKNTLMSYPIDSRISSLKHIAVTKNEEKLIYTLTRDHSIQMYDTRKNISNNIKRNITLSERKEMANINDLAKEGKVYLLGEWLDRITEKRY